MDRKTVTDMHLQLEDEPPRTFSRMIPLDGNNSMKRTFQLGEHRSINAQPFTDSDYLLPPEYVDQFKDEVRSARAPGVPVGDEEVEGDSSEATLRAQCTTNWKAASADERKKMWGVFVETGYFLSACRHSLICWFSDMIRSGELYVVLAFVSASY